MRRPRDVSPKTWQRVMAEARGLDLQSTLRVGGTRYLRFTATSAQKHYRVGTLVEVPVACRFSARRSPC